MEEELLEWLERRFKGQQDIDEQEGGILRQYSGDTGEDFVIKTFSLLKPKYPNLNIEVKRGPNDTVRVYSVSGKYYVDESVDKHIYVNGKFIAAIECKTYLDKCYLQRADADFILLRKVYPNLKTSVLSLENGLHEQSLNFYLERGNVDKVFILFTGKRNSAAKKRIYFTYKDRVDKELIKNWVAYIEEILDDENRKLEEQGN